MITESAARDLCHNPRCLGHYDFGEIARYARMRFVDGFDTVALMNRATSRREKEEIALVCMLDVDDGVVRGMQLDCQHAGQCEVTDCRERLRELISRDLASRENDKP